MFSSFMINSWIVATLVAVVAGVIGFFVVARGAAFAAHSLPLSAFPGAALAAVLGVNPILCMILFAGLGVLGISQLGRLARQDVATGLTLVALLGLGSLFLSLTQEYSQAVYALLFGEVLGIGNDQIAPEAIAGLAAIGLTGFLVRPLLLNSLSPELGELRGIPARRMEICFLAVVALATASAVPVVGALLVFSLMVAPPAAARLLTRRPGAAVALSVAIALVTVWGAIALSYQTNWPIGFFVGGLGAVFYGVARLRPVLAV
jgi:zinc/manganese transport system permease protein